MSDEEQQSPDALQLAHEKLEGVLSEQRSHSEHIDEKAMGTLRVSFTISSITAAVFYYIARQQNQPLLGSIDNPFTYAALLFGGLSLLLSFATVLHTKIETELTPLDLKKQVEFGQNEFLVTLVMTYPNYIRRNDDRLSTDINLLTGSHVCLILTVASIITSTLVFINGRTIDFYGVIAVTFISGTVFGVVILWLGLSLITR